MTSLQQIKKNIKKNENQQITDLETYYIGNGIPILTKIIKAQNVILLNWVSNHKKLNTLQKKELFSNYLKLNYYSPSIK